MRLFIYFSYLKQSSFKEIGSTKMGKIGFTRPMQDSVMVMPCETVSLRSLSYYWESGFTGMEVYCELSNLQRNYDLGDQICP